MSNTQEELREKLENISCEFGKPHEDTCDLNQEYGAVNGCSCSVGDLMDSIVPIINQSVLQALERVKKMQKSYLSELTSNDDDADYDDFVATHLSAIEAIEKEYRNE